MNICVCERKKGILVNISRSRKIEITHFDAFLLVKITPASQIKKEERGENMSSSKIEHDQAVSSQAIPTADVREEDVLLSLCPFILDGF